MAAVGPLGKPKKGKKVVVLAPPDNGIKDLMRHFKKLEVVDPNSKFHPAPNLAQVKVKRDDGRSVMLDLYESDSHGSAPKSFKQMLIDAKAVLFVVKNSQPTSLDVLTLYLSSAHAIPGRKYLVVCDEVPGEMASLKEEQLESWARTKGCSDVTHFDQQTGSGVDALLTKIATAVTSQPAPSI